MSSDSKTRSSKNSGSSRSKSSRSSSRPQRHDDLKPVDQSPPNDGRTNVVAMVLGMITSIVLLFGVLGLGGGRVVNEKYDAEMERRKEERYKAKRADTLEELEIKLSELSVKKSKDLQEAVFICQSRIEISDQILQRGPTDEDMRAVAVIEGLLARVKLYGLDFTSNLNDPTVSSDLEAAYLPYLDDKNEKVFSNARVALLTHRSFETLKSDEKDVAELVNLFSDTINRFPGDDYVASMIEAHMFVLIEREPEYSRELFTRLRQRHRRGTLKPAMERKMRNIADRMLIKGEDLERKFTDRWANGKQGRQDLVDSAARLLDSEEVGSLIVRRCSAIAQWLEQNEFFELAKSIYDEIIASAKGGNIFPEYREAAVQDAQNGLARLELVGKTIEYRGLDTSGKQLIDAEVKKKIAVVVYWSLESAPSLRFLAELNASTRVMGNKPILILAVCTDAEVPAEIVQLRRKSPMIQVLHPDFETGKNSLLEICPPGNLPHVMLVNFGGVIEDANADPKQVKDKALSLLMNRNR